MNIAKTFRDFEEYIQQEKRVNDLKQEGENLRAALAEHQAKESELRDVGADNGGVAVLPTVLKTVQQRRAKTEDLEDRLSATNISLEIETKRLEEIAKMTKAKAREPVEKQFKEMAMRLSASLRAAEEQFQELLTIRRQAVRAGGTDAGISGSKIHEQAAFMAQVKTKADVFMTVAQVEWNW